MALAIVVTLENEPDAPAPSAKTAPGKALARELERLDYAAKCCKTPAISSLLSENPAALAAQMREEGFDPSKMRLPAEKWYDAAEGLKSMRALIEYLNGHFNDFKQPNPILRDLKAAEAVLTGAQTSGKRFHFTKLSV